MTRSELRNAASTLAHHWGQGGASNRLGVERLLLAYPPRHQCALCAAVVQMVRERDGDEPANAFEDMLYDAVNLS